MPADWGLYLYDGEEGTEVSSTYEGRHITCTAAEIITDGGEGEAVKGHACIFGIIGLQAVGVCFNTGSTTDLIAIDTEGIWNLPVYGKDDVGDRVLRPGEPVYIHNTSCQISGVTDEATQVPFGYLLTEVASGAETISVVKVHWDPLTPAILDGAKTFNGAVTMDSTLNVAGIADFASGVLIYGTLNVVENVTFTYACTFLNLGWSSLAGCTFTPDPADGFTRVFMGGLPLGAGGLASGRLWENAGVINIIP